MLITTSKQFVKPNTYFSKHKSSVRNHKVSSRSVQELKKKKDYKETNHFRLETESLFSLSFVPIRLSFSLICGQPRLCI